MSDGTWHQETNQMAMSNRPKNTQKITNLHSDVSSNSSAGRNSNIFEGFTWQSFKLIGMKKKEELYNLL